MRVRGLAAKDQRCANPTRNFFINQQILTKSANPTTNAPYIFALFLFVYFKIRI